MPLYRPGGRVLPAVPPVGLLSFRDDDVHALRRIAWRVARCADGISRISSAIALSCWLPVSLF